MNDGSSRSTVAKTAVLACCIAMGTLGPATALAQTGSRQSAAATFVEQQPGVPTALTFDVDYVNPDDPGAKPPAVRTLVETLAQGARFDTTVPAQCTVPDSLLLLQGEGACPPGSKVGTGYIRIDTGLPGPNRYLDEDVVFLNNADQLIFLTTDRDSGARFVSRSTIQGGRLTSNAPTLPGTPPDGAAIDVVHSQLESISQISDGQVRGYITTPDECPPGETWLNSLSFTYADGVTQRVESPSPCMGGVPEAPKPGRCANRWEGGPEPDRHTGTFQGDRLLGFRGKDNLRGGHGADCLHGNRGADVLRGGRGPDRLIGGPGIDTCHGGRGRDRLRGCERVR